MADKIDFKMFYLIFSFILIINDSFTFAVVPKDDKVCSCYDMCSKNFTTNSVKDVQKVTACQRGCRFYSLVLHTSHDVNPAKDYIHAKEGCLFSCSESYSNPLEKSACNFGCSAEKTSRMLCNSLENEIPQIGYSLWIEESDVLIHPGEPDPDDVLTDPGLRKQFEKTLEALLDSKPKLPEIHFRNLPIRNQKTTREYSHVNFKCPKFYGLDSKFEFRNGKIIIGDLYLFVGVFVFVVVCFILGHHIETRNMARQLMETRISKKDDFGDREPLLKVDMDEGELIQKEGLPDYPTAMKAEVLEVNGSIPEAKFDAITLVFHEDDLTKDNQSNENSLKI